MENKDDLVEELLKRQGEMATKQPNSVKEEMEKAESFAWMDEAMKTVLMDKLTNEEMNKLDECVRANFVGQRMMTAALKDGLARYRERRENKEDE